MGEREMMTEHETQDEFREEWGVKIHYVEDMMWAEAHIKDIAEGLFGPYKKEEDKTAEELARDKRLDDYLRAEKARIGYNDIEIPVYDLETDFSPAMREKLRAQIREAEANPETRKIMPYFPFPETQYAENEQTGTKNDGVRENKKYQVQGYDNKLTAEQRISALAKGENIYLHLDDGFKDDGNWKWWCNRNLGVEAVKEYEILIKKFAKQYDVDENLIKAVIFIENACGHYYGGNALMDYMGISKSQRPMNVRGDIWGNFRGKYYDTYNPEQNIELGVILLKQIHKSLDNPTVDRIITLWNNIGRNTISSFGYRGKKAYDMKLWQTR